MDFDIVIFVQNRSTNWTINQNSGFPDNEEIHYLIRILSKAAPPKC